MPEACVDAVVSEAPHRKAAVTKPTTRTAEGYIFVIKKEEL
jgi:hypothetical protein